MTTAILPPSAVQNEVHPLAVCCWCGASFQRGPDVIEVNHPERPYPWVCPAHWPKQLQRAMVVSVKGRGTKVTRFVPLPRQVDAMEALDGRPTYVLLGGAAGGSKSKGLREIAHTECLKTAGFRVLLLRRTYKELDQTHIRDAELEAPEMGAVTVPSAKLVRYPNGSTLQFGHCETSADAANYLSAEYDLIIFDELVTFEELQFLLISSRARSTKAGVTPKVLAGTNPGGPQSAWVRARFIDKTVDREQYPDYDPEDYIYIPSKLDDNPYLDRAYERKLLALPPELRRAYRDGDWDIFPGQYFPEFRRAVHVVDRPIPETAVWYLAIDGGFINPAAFLWIAMWDGHAYVRHEWNPVRVLNSDQAKQAKTWTSTYGIRSLRFAVADTSLWTPEKDTGESAAETFARYGLPLLQATKDRVNGWKRLREWLAMSPDGTPWLWIHPDCTYLIRTLPSLVSDPNCPEDVDTDGEDHSADALRYFVMARPAPASKPEPVPLPKDSVGSLIRSALRKTGARRWGRVA